MRANTLASTVVPILSLTLLGGLVALHWSSSARTPDEHVAAAPKNASGDVRWESVPGLPGQLAIRETVFWDPRDTDSLRQLLLGSSLVQDKTVLEIGTGSGLLSLCCLQAGADRVVATDVNRFAIATAAYNAQQAGLADRLELRLVSLEDPSAYSVIGGDERFDLIISNPPWEDAPPTTIDSYALYDPGFQLLRSMLAELRDHLAPEGRALLAYGCVSAIKKVQELAEQHELQLRVLDERELESLPEVFLPGMLLELRPRKEE